MKWMHLIDDFFFCIDDEDYEEVSKYSWHKTKSHHINCSALDHIYLHHFLIGKHPGLQVDHINRAPWDNRRSNLRIVTQQENLKNKGFPVNPPHPSMLEMQDAKIQKTLLQIQNKRNAGLLKWEDGVFDHNRKKVVDSNGVVYASVTEAAKKYGIKATTMISQCCLGRRATAGGTTWKHYQE